MHNFEANYNKILETLRLNIEKDNFITQKRKPKLSDIELIAIDLTAEYMSIDSEHQLFRDLKSTSLHQLIERTVYNRRKRGLVRYIEEIRVIISEKFNQFEEYFVNGKVKINGFYETDILENDYKIYHENGLLKESRIYKNGIQNGVLLEKNRISRFTFFNTIGAALKVGAFDWAEEFVENNQHLLAERQLKSTVQFNLARIFFEKKDLMK